MKLNIKEVITSLINKVPSTKGCCCGCTLETGCKIIGWIQTIISVISLIPYFVLLVSFSLLLVSSPASSILGIITTIISAAINAVIFVLGLFLLYGVYKGDVNRVKIWLIGHVALLVVHTIIFFLDLVGAILTVGLMIGPLLATLIWIIVTVYCIMVVKSFYEEKTREPAA